MNLLAFVAKSHGISNSNKKQLVKHVVVTSKKTQTESQSIHLATSRGFVKGCTSFGEGFPWRVIFQGYVQFIDSCKAWNAPAENRLAVVPSGNDSQVANWKMAQL